MSKLRIYPTGTLRYVLKTDIPNLIVNIARIVVSFFPKQFLLPLKMKLLLMPSHRVLLTNARNYSGSTFPEIDILIPFHPKDIALLSPCLINVTRNSINPIGTVRVITTNLGVPIVEKELSDLYSDTRMQNFHIEVISERDFLPSTVLEACHSLGEGSGWLIKQSIFFWNSVKNSKNPTVVIDSDTLIIQKILWIDSENRSNIFANFHENDLSDFFNEIFPNILRIEKDFGFVSHFVLVKPHIVLEFLLQVERSQFFRESQSEVTLAENNLEIRLASVLELLIQKCMFNFCDFDFYAKAALKIEPESTLICKWSNLAIDVQDKTDEFSLQKFLHKTQGSFLSVSMHTFSLTFSGSARTQEIIESKLKSKEAST